MSHLVGTPESRLIVLRGNSASGKSSVAREIRARYGRGIAIVGQDTLRREVLKERDEPGAANIDLTARYALDHGFHVIVEGILYVAHYGEMLRALARDHRGITRFSYLDVSFPETVRRHATKPQATEYGETEMRTWFRPRDLLDGVDEMIIPEECSQDEAVERVMSASLLPDPGH